MSEWTPDLQTQREVAELWDTMMRELVYQLGVDEIIPSCEIVNMDPYATGTYPRYIKVLINRYHQDVTYRGGAGVGVGDYVHVIHLRKGDRYEVLMAGGAAGTSTFSLEALDDYARGFIIRGGATEWEAYDANDDGQILVGDGTDINSVAVSGDVDLDNAGVAEVVGLRGRDLQDAAPADGETLVWSDVNNRWEPQAQYGSESGVVHLHANKGWPSLLDGCGGPTQTMFAAYNVNIVTLDFDPTDIEYAEWTKRMPEDWDGGNLTFDVTWTAIDPGLYSYLGDSVEWNLQVNAYSDGERLDRAWGATVEVTDLFQGERVSHVSPESGPVTPSGPAYLPAGGDLLQFRLWRDAANDNLPADAMVLVVTVYYSKG